MLKLFKRRSMKSVPAPVNTWDIIIRPSQSMQITLPCLGAGRFTELRVVAPGFELHLNITPSPSETKSGRVRRFLNYLMEGDINHPMGE